MPPDEPAIRLEHVSKRFGRTLAVDDLSLEIPRGEVFGFVGENAAGKTTTIRLLLGHAKAGAGTVRVLGENPRDSRRVHLLMARVGYLSESRAMYDWMSVREIIDFCAALRGAQWDAAYAEALREQYDLDPAQKVRHMSRGKRALLMLLLAVAHRPELLILDEPSSGLDPIARREILEQVIDVVQAEGRTVFFSSHLLDEVERVADRVGFMHRGRLTTVEALDTLHERWRRVQVVWPEAREAPSLPGVRRLDVHGREHMIVTDAFDERVLAELRGMGAVEVAANRMNLDDIFVESMRPQRPAATARESAA